MNEQGQAIRDLRRGPGELSFEAVVGGEERVVRFRGGPARAPAADVALAACLLPAMRRGGNLRLPEPVSPRLLRNQRVYQSIQRAWSREWDLGEPPLRDVEVRAPQREVTRSETGRVGAFFSGGVDSWSTVLGNPEVTDLIFVRGLDLVPGHDDHAALADEVESRLQAAAAGLGLPLHVVETNVRELSDPLVI